MAVAWEEEKKRMGEGESLSVKSLSGVGGGAIPEQHTGQDLHRNESGLMEACHKVAVNQSELPRPEAQTVMDRFGTMLMPILVLLAFYFPPPFWSMMT